MPNQPVPADKKSKFQALMQQLMVSDKATQQLVIDALADMSTMSHKDYRRIGDLLQMTLYKTKPKTKLITTAKYHGARV